ncbi:MAG: hypothetical protein KAI24_20645 [Planctomycetes bacterium]|nr:hypothetical protein [Planctomycetota bacterium]
MRPRRSTWIRPLGSCLLLLAACDVTDVEGPSAPDSDLALPVTAPMRAREHLLGELEQHGAAERDRARTIDGLIPSRR